MQVNQNFKLNEALLCKSLGTLNNQLPNYIRACRRALQHAVMKSESITGVIIKIRVRTFLATIGSNLKIVINHQLVDIGPPQTAYPLAQNLTHFVPLYL